MNLGEDVYHYRGQELEDAIDTYINNGLTGYSIKDAIDEWQAQLGESLESNSESVDTNT